MEIYVIADTHRLRVKQLDCDKGTSKWNLVMKLTLH